MRVNDPSVSRNHANIELKEGKFILNDLQSKYGTMVAMNQPFGIYAGKKKEIQIMKIHLQLSCMRLSEQLTSRRFGNDQSLTCDVAKTVGQYEDYDR